MGSGSRVAGKSTVAPYGLVMGFEQANRLAAFAALGSAAVLFVLGVDVVVSGFRLGVAVLVGLVIAVAAGWYGLTRTGATRLLGSGIAILALVLTVGALLANGDHIGQALVIVVGLGLMLVATRAASQFVSRTQPWLWARWMVCGSPVPWMP